jgi:hypothetical protein
MFPNLRPDLRFGCSSFLLRVEPRRNEEQHGACFAAYDAETKIISP